MLVFCSSSLLPSLPCAIMTKAPGQPSSAARGHLPFHFALSPLQGLPGRRVRAPVLETGRRRG